MTILEIQKRVIVLNAKQLMHIKGGSNDANSAEILIIEDVDAL